MTTRRFFFGEGGREAAEGGPPVLYATSDGLLQPLGYSQVVRVVKLLAARGIRYEILSSERPSDLADAERVASLEAELAGAGVRWHHTVWRTGTRADAAANLRRLAQAALRRCLESPVRLVHARAYHASAVAWPLRRALGVPYLFDARSYWIDERCDEGRWFRNPVVLNVAKRLERRLYLDASAIVTLTRIQQDDLHTGRLGFAYDGPIETIPTCADYNAFGPRLESPPGPWDRIKANAAGGRVFAVIGSINASYRTQETLELARRALALDPSSLLLVLTAQKAEFRRRLAAVGIEDSRCSVHSARHIDMPHWLRQVDWALSLLRTSDAKRASMPTKLAEWFAAGVRPAHHGCNEEVSGWVRKAGSGYVLDDLSPSALDACAHHLATARRPTTELEEARERTRPHFDLSAGVERYREILGRLQAASPTSGQPFAPPSILRYRRAS